jgi:CheY-like chemotaxis protein
LRVAESLPPADSADLAGVPVLLVEDHDAARMVLVRRLAAWGLDVTAVSSGTEALMAMKGGKFQIALIDMTLPEGGLALASSVRAIGGEASPRIVLLTAGDTPPAKEQTRLGLTTLAKPARSSDLLAALRDGAPSPGKAGARNAPLPRMRGRVLLAEDNEVNRTIVIAWLNRLGLTTVTAVNGIEAVAQIREGGVDLVLMDCQMPEMDGFAATEEIRAFEALEGRSPVPIIALTANAMEGDRDCCLKAGMNDYLTKPFRGSQLTEMLLHWLRAKPEETPAAERAAFAELASLCKDYADHGREETLAAIEAAWKARPKLLG